MKLDLLGKVLLGIFIVGVLTLSTQVDAKRMNHEKIYQASWCKDKGEFEHVLPNKSRVDCLTDTHAVEADFANKFYEAIGQSLYYSVKTGKKAGILLIVPVMIFWVDPIIWLLVMNSLRIKSILAICTLTPLTVMAPLIFQNIITMRLMWQHWILARFHVMLSILVPKKHGWLILRPQPRPIVRVSL